MTKRQMRKEDKFELTTEGTYWWVPPKGENMRASHRREDDELNDECEKNRKK